MDATSLPPMVRAETSFQLLYVSRLAPGCTWEIVKEIVAASRKHNPAHGIGGALLFDGERFCQLIEGAEANVQALLRNIVRDPRHTDVKVLFEGESLGARAMPRWASGYCDSHELEALDGESGLRDRPALHGFVLVLKAADLE